MRLARIHQHILTIFLIIFFLNICMYWSMLHEVPRPWPGGVYIDGMYCMLSCWSMLSVCKQMIGHAGFRDDVHHPNTGRQKVIFCRV